MNRQGHEDARFFFGREVEHTPAHGLMTLFVVGVQPVNDIRQAIQDYNLHVEHVFFGANHSFHPGQNFPSDADQWQAWDDMITPFLQDDYLCTLDIPVSHAESFLEGALIEHNNFIPQIRVSIPYIKLWNYNTMIKIDDRDFDSTNPGVWCHRLQDLMSKDRFTAWRDYREDRVL